MGKQIDVIKTEEYITATDCKTIFHHVYVDDKLICSTGQPYIIKSKVLGTVNDKEDDLVNRIYVNPIRIDGEYKYDELIPKAESELLKEVEPEYKDNNFGVHEYNKFKVE